MNIKIKARNKNKMTFLNTLPYSILKTLHNIQKIVKDQNIKIAHKLTQTLKSNFT